MLPVPLQERRDGMSPLTCSLQVSLAIIIPHCCFTACYISGPSHVRAHARSTVFGS